MGHLRQKTAPPGPRDSDSAFQKTSHQEDTLRKWLAAYKANAFDGLKLQGHSDQGHARKIPAEVFEKAVALKKEAPQRGVAKIIRR